MRPTFANTLMRTLRRLQRQGQHTTSSAAASTGSVNTNTFKESGYRFNYFEPKNAAAYEEAQADIAYWLKDVNNDSYHFITPSGSLQAAPMEAPIAPPIAPIAKPHSGLTTPEGISFSFEPPSSQQLWTPLQNEYAARIYLQKELAAEDALANSNFQNEFDMTPCPLTPAEPDFLDDFGVSVSLPDQATESATEFEVSSPLLTQTNPELPSEFDISPPLHLQPPTPVVLKAHQRAKLAKRFQASVESPTPSEDTYQRLLKGYSTSTSTSESPLASRSVDPAVINRPSAPEPMSFSRCDDQQAEVDRLKQENAGLQRELKAYKNMADSLIEKSVEQSFGDRDERRLRRRFDRLQRRLDEDDSVIAQQNIKINLITDERDSLQSSLQEAYDLIINMRKDINHYADRIEDLEGDLHDAHRELNSLNAGH